MLLPRFVVACDARPFAGFFWRPALPSSRRRTAAGQSCPPFRPPSTIFAPPLEHEQRYGWSSRGPREVNWDYGRTPRYAAALPFNYTKTLQAALIVNSAANRRSAPVRGPRRLESSGTAVLSARHAASNELQTLASIASPKPER